MSRVGEPARRDHVHVQHAVAVTGVTRWVAHTGTLRAVNPRRRHVCATARRNTRFCGACARRGDATQCLTMTALSTSPSGSRRPDEGAATIRTRQLVRTPHDWGARTSCHTRRAQHTRDTQRRDNGTTRAASPPHTHILKKWGVAPVRPTHLPLFPERPIPRHVERGRLKPRHGNACTRRFECTFRTHLGEATCSVCPVSMHPSVGP